MPFAKNHDVIKAFASERADQALTVSVLPRRACSGWLIANAHGVKAPFEGVAIGVITVADEIFRRLLPVLVAN